MKGLTISYTELQTKPNDMAEMIVFLIVFCILAYLFLKTIKVFLENARFVKYSEIHRKIVYICIFFILLFLCFGMIIHLIFIPKYFSKHKKIYTGTINEKQIDKKAFYKKYKILQKNGNRVVFSVKEWVSAFTQGVILFLTKSDRIYRYYIDRKCYI